MIGVGVGVGVSRRRGDPDAAIRAALFGSGEPGVMLIASQLSLMFQDQAGTVPAAVGQPVLNIQDYSGNGNHATYTSGPVLEVDSGGHPYLLFSGTETLVTGAIDFTGTDKISVFASVRKLSDANSMVCELSASTTSNNGAFYVGSDQVAATDWTFALRGSATSYMSVTGYGQPVTSIIEVYYDLAKTTIQEEITANIDSSPVTGTYGPTAGTGSFGNHALYIGSRAALSNFFVGRFYSLIVRGAI